VTTLEEVIEALEGDVRLARTRDEHVRLTARVLALRSLATAEAAVTVVVPGPDRRTDR